MINRHADRCECLCLCPSVCLSIYLLGERRVVGLLRVVVCRREGAFLFVCVCVGVGVGGERDFTGRNNSQLALNANE